MVDFLIQNQYFAIFVGLLLGGETILLPALYFSAIGQLNIWFIILIMIVATVISDTIWYFLGFGLSEGVSWIKLSQRKREIMERYSTLFSERALFLLFMSKFVYGTRVVAQILCGVYKIDFKKYFIINLAGIAALTAFYAVGIRLFGIAADLIPAFHKNAKLSFAAGAIVILLVHIAVSIYLKRKSFYLE